MNINKLIILLLFLLFLVVVEICYRGYIKNDMFRAMILFCILFCTLLFLIFMKFAVTRIRRLENIQYENIQPKITSFFGMRK